VALKLKEMGFQKVYALKGGWKEWQASGFPVERK
jgi:3-mercaptopyruvate sulfurtransferase SseA